MTRPMKGWIHCSCGWSVPATKETQSDLAIAHARTHQTPPCQSCGEWLEFCDCETDQPVAHTHEIMASERESDTGVLYCTICDVNLTEIPEDDEVSFK